ncbi:hypothetical protein PhaeoP18_01312 [Phaeobacter piscinae]|uniref:Uncharacterized protein n=1 Tax=Phaeobacter piscinae TaxID=1580596 RepID=A0AAN1GQP9_9RHOB|nr:hypothetical protein [Phaeobacter piscinae]ATG43271.1 hypothetical protein PhaeoP13_01327 [Phaeobacter piscinae]AUR35589.1 hypothetical protein PhaeoP18_01312 [Phaeobacter piscinae]
MSSLRITNSGFGLFMRLNWDRAMSVATILGALAAGAWIGSL